MAPSSGQAGPGVAVIGAGLAGCEAAWQLARRGLEVRLWEMRPALMTPAHSTGDLAELVCSNSLGSDHPDTAGGLLKAELREMGSLLIDAADRTRVPAGRALAVDRRRFSAEVTGQLADQPRIRLIREERVDLPEDQVAVIATGPLTSDRLASALASFTGQSHLRFFDAVAPIVTLASVDPARSFWASRYQPERPDYLNCPMTEEEYVGFYQALLAAELHPRHDFEPAEYFEGCLPVEELARRGQDTLRYGPLKPVGLMDPATGRQPYAVVQLRREDLEGRLLNLVGFQTSLTQAAQRRVFRMVPALRSAEFVRYGVMHRNTFLRGPQVLRPTLEARARPGLCFAGQITGVEGYTEAVATGLVAGISAARRATGGEPVEPPPASMIGSLCAYVSGWPSADFQPMGAHFGLLPGLPGRSRRLERPHAYRVRALGAIAAWRDLTQAAPG